MSSTELDNARKFMGSFIVPAGTSLAERRTKMAARGASLPCLPGVSAEPVNAGGVPAEWVRVGQKFSGRYILFFHGGGFVEGEAAAVRDPLARLCAASEASALSIDYRLAPENPFPAAVEDALTAWRWMVQQGLSPQSCVFAGSSAGGGLAVSAMVALRDAGDPLPACGILFSPWTDMTWSGGSLDANASTDVVDSQSIAEYRAMYLQGERPDHPLASPALANLIGLPPLLALTGTAEILIDSVRNFVRRASAAGVDVTNLEYPDMFHGWQNLAAILPEAQAALEAAGAFIHSRCQ